MSLKTIQMDPTHLKISKQKKSKKSIVPPSVMVNQPNLRELLLSKLRKHRKTQKINDPIILNNSFDSQCSITPMNAMPMNAMPMNAIPVSVAPMPSIPSLSIPVSSIPVSETMVSNTSPVSNTIHVSSSSDKPYGVLKNGIKPTYKQWNLSQKNLQRHDVSPTVQPVTQPVSPPVTVQAIPVQVALDPEILPEPVVEKEYKKPVVIGKSKKNKTVHVLIPCHKTRKLRSEQRETYKKTNLTTVKNYLKQHKLIKVGSTAPTNLIREMYENAKSYGDIINENKHNLLYNFEKEDEKES